MFSDVTLSQRLEGAEGHACAQFSEARRRSSPSSGAEWREIAGAYAVFDGVGSPVTQTFGLGLFEPLSEDTLNTVEQFFIARHADVDHEVSPMAGTATFRLLCKRHYQPIEISNVLYRSLQSFADETPTKSKHPVRVVEPAEAFLWADVNARGWCHEHPELRQFLLTSAAIASSREGAVNFLAELEGNASAAGALFVESGVALLAGAATVPEARGRGLQAALLQERLKYACEHGCDLAMMVAEAGSGSQRNAERQGFRIAYTRMKWRLLR